MTQIQLLRRRAAEAHPSAFTQAELARRIGVSMRTLQAWESGGTKPSRRHKAALARELGVPVAELAGEAAE